ncbi:MAG: hypothetical protein ACRC9L_02555 [Brevinema sp.]
MPWISMILSFLCLLYGFVGILIVRRRPHTVVKLQKMKDIFGDSKGLLIYIVLYNLFPVGVGIFLLIQIALGKAVL